MLSFWEKDVFLKKYDVLIVGAGFSGLWLAFFLKKQNPKIQIAILERGVLPTGASTKNAGFSCFGSPTELLENIAVMGVDEAMFLAEQRFRGIKMIEQYGPQSLPTKDHIYMHFAKNREGDVKILKFINDLKYNNIKEPEEMVAPLPQVITN